MNYRIFSKHTGDLQLFMGAWIVSMTALTLAATGLLFVPTLKAPYLPMGIGVPFIGIIITASLAIGQRIHDQATKRLQTVDLLLSEISSICSVIYGMDLLRRFEEMYWGAYTPLAESVSRQESEENYLEVFSKVISELGGLRPDVVLEVTAFYSYLKGSRDTYRATTSWTSATPERIRKDDVTDLIVNTYLCLNKAASSIIALLESEQDSGNSTLVLINRMRERSWIYLQSVGFSKNTAQTLGLVGGSDLNQVRIRAYFKWKHSTDRDGKDIDFWKEAMDEVINETLNLTAP